MWEVVGDLDKPITIVATAADPAFLDRADEVVASISFEAP